MQDASPRVQAVGDSVVRTLPVLPFWVARTVAQSSGPAAISPWTLLFDFCLVAGHVWAIIPVARFQGPLFPNKRQLSTGFMLPIVWALFFTGRDLYFAFTGRLL